jgi:hypothetical protein
MYPTYLNIAVECFGGGGLNAYTNMYITIKYRQEQCTLNDHTQQHYFVFLKQTFTGFEPGFDGHGTKSQWPFL